MSIWKGIVDHARKSNQKAARGYAEHDRKVSDKACCHCRHYAFGGCTKHKFDLSVDESKKYTCDDFSPESISWWKL